MNDRRTSPLPRRSLRTWQTIRRALFHVHLWTGIAIGLYILMISITGSVLVYRNELLFRAKTPGELQFVSALLDLHDNLLAGETGRAINGMGAIGTLVLVTTGAVIWWPGAGKWRRSLTVPRGLSWPRTVWQLHSAIGFWTLAFTLVFALSGAYLCYPDAFQLVADRLEPVSDDSTLRVTDQVIYWLAYLHFGRINGIGIPCSGPGVCDQLTKGAWALFGLAPAAMFVTGVVMWWNRVLRKRRTSPTASV
jgi:uncharacterized iron-regulated membrane protein